MKKDKPEIPKDYADKSWMDDLDDWEYENKETFLETAKILFYVITTAAMGMLVYWYLAGSLL